jgi:DNA-directed RNA polymerase subunit RPC12/RpoP
MARWHPGRQQRRDQPPPGRGLTRRSGAARVPLASQSPLDPSYCRSGEEPLRLAHQKIKPTERKRMKKGKWFWEEDDSDYTSGSCMDCGSAIEVPKNRQSGNRCNDCNLIAMNMKTKENRK